MASSFKLANDFIDIIRNSDPVMVENFLMSNASKDIAIVLSKLQSEEQEEILVKVAERKRNDIEADIRYLKRVKITDDQYYKIAQPMIHRLSTGESVKVPSKYFRPSKKSGYGRG